MTGTVRSIDWKRDGDTGQSVLRVVVEYRDEQPNLPLAVISKQIPVEIFLAERTRANSPRK